MAAGVQIKHKRKTSAFTGGELAAGEFGLNTNNGIWYYSLDGASVTSLDTLYQAVDATLTALAAADWVANAIPIGSGANTLSQVTFAINTFPARASTGNLVAKPISAQGLSLVAGEEVAAYSFYAGDSTGAVAAPNFRAIGINDLPTIIADKGGTGQTVYAVGDLLYASTTATLSKLADIATGNALISGGVTTAPSWGKIEISTHVSGLGTGVATFLATPSSANLAVAITDEIGTAGKVVFDTAPTFQTSIDMATGGSYLYSTTAVIRAITANNTYLFANSGLSTLANNTGTENTGLGNLALGAGAAANVSGGNNVAVGNKALWKLTTGTSNVGIGWFALGSLTTQGSNTAVGYNALGNMTGGNANCAVGFNALSDAVTGGDNLAFGAYALWKNTSGTNNCAFGSSALVLNTTGTQNTGFGREALQNNTKGCANVAIGYQSLYNYKYDTAVTDTKHVAIGASAGRTLDNTGTAFSCTFIGYTCGYDATSGSSNTFVGANTGRGITTGGSNTIIGAGVTGLAVGLTSNIILANGGGTIKAQHDGTDWTLTGKVNAAGTVALRAGTTAAGTSPLKFQSGTNLTTAEAGACEYDGAVFYQTTDTTSGRGQVPVEQYFYLNADGSTISTIANFFGSTSNVSLVANAYYEIEIFAYFLNTTSGTVTWTFTNSAAPTSQNIHFRFSPVGGVNTTTGGADYLHGDIVKDATATKALSATGTLTSAVNHQAHFKIWLKNGTGTSLKIQATKNVGGTITPLTGSYYRCRRMPASTTGTFAA